MEKILVWFRNDLRLLDNESLYKASLKSPNLLPVYVWEDRFSEKNILGKPKMGNLRANFLWQSLCDLQKNLQDIGSNLLVRKGNAEQIIVDGVKKYDIKNIYTSKEIADEEVRIEEKLSKKLEKLGVKIHFFDTASLYLLKDLPFDLEKTPDIFTEYRKQVEKRAYVSSPFPKPKNLIFDFDENTQIPTLESLGFSLIKPHYKSVLHFVGGETAAWQRLDDYFWQKDLLKTYKETRNGLLGADYSSKFSPWLANGSLSARAIYQQVGQYEKQRTKNESTYWLIFELLWRDYFRLMLLKYGNLFFQEGGIIKKAPFRKNNLALFEKWVNGETGENFVDANMKELQQTGFMSNRGRQNVASFLVHQLRLNWLWGAAYFEHQLLDYDVHSNYANWAYVAGVGNDPRPNRYFNVQKQAQMYDANGDYVRFWLAK